MNAEAYVPPYPEQELRKQISRVKQPQSPSHREGTLWYVLIYFHPGFQAKFYNALVDLYPTLPRNEQAILDQMRQNVIDYQTLLQQQSSQSLAQNPEFDPSEELPFGSGGGDGSGSSNRGSNSNTGTNWVNGIKVTTKFIADMVKEGFTRGTIDKCLESTAMANTLACQRFLAAAAGRTAGTNSPGLPNNTNTQTRTPIAPQQRTNAIPQPVLWGGLALFGLFLMTAATPQAAPAGRR